MSATKRNKQRYVFVNLSTHRISNTLPPHFRYEFKLITILIYQLPCYYITIQWYEIISEF